MGSDGAGAALASGVTVAVTAGDIAVAGAVPAAGDMAGAVVVPGDTATEAPGAAGAVVVSGAAATEAPGAAASAAVERAGEVVGAPGGLISGLAAGLCAKLASAAVMEQRLTISVFFISGRLWCSTKDSGDGGVIPEKRSARRGKVLAFSSGGASSGLPIFIRILR